MPTLEFKVEFVDKVGFHPLAEGVKLAFPSDCGTFPAPKDRIVEALFERECPLLMAKVPTKTNLQGFTFRQGLCFTVTKRL